MCYIFDIVPSRYNLMCCLFSHWLYCTMKKKILMCILFFHFFHTVQSKNINMCYIHDFLYVILRLFPLCPGLVVLLEKYKQ